MKALITTFALLFPASCAGSLPSISDARTAVEAARAVQAVACLQLPAAPEWAERCHQATKALLLAEKALRGAQELESALEADTGAQ
jgi:hypothetical protein